MGCVLDLVTKFEHVFLEGKLLSLRLESYEACLRHVVLQPALDVRDIFFQRSLLHVHFQDLHVVVDRLKRLNCLFQSRQKVRRELRLHELKVSLHLVKSDFQYLRSLH